MDELKTCQKTLSEGNSKYLLLFKGLHSVVKSCELSSIQRKLQKNCPKQFC